jgi:hypothetical protein
MIGGPPDNVPSVTPYGVLSSATPNPEFRYASLRAVILRASGAREICQGGELNSRPRAYESPALPLSYPGVGDKFNTARADRVNGPGS